MPAHPTAPEASTNLIFRHLPYLRRYGRALTGSAASGDAYVRMVLETLAQDGLDVLGPTVERLGLFRLFHRIYASGHLELEDESQVAERMDAGALLRTLPCERREALLLTAVEGFSAGEAAWILGLSQDVVEGQIHLARRAFRDRLRSGVLMLEDDMSIRLPVTGTVDAAVIRSPAVHAQCPAHAQCH